MGDLSSLQHKHLWKVGRYWTSECIMLAAGVLTHSSPTSIFYLHIWLRQGGFLGFKRGNKIHPSSHDYKWMFMGNTWAMISTDKLAQWGNMSAETDLEPPFLCWFWEYGTGNTSQRASVLQCLFRHYKVILCNSHAYYLVRTVIY